MPHPARVPSLPFIVPPFCLCCSVSASAPARRAHANEMPRTLQTRSASVTEAKLARQGVGESATERSNLQGQGSAKRGGGRTGGRKQGRCARIYVQPQDDARSRRPPSLARPPPHSPPSLRCRAFSRRTTSCATLKMPPVGCSHTKHFADLALCCSTHCSQGGGGRGRAGALSGRASHRIECTGTSPAELARCDAPAAATAHGRCFPRCPRCAHLFTKVVLALGDHRVLRVCPHPPTDEAGEGQLVVLFCRQARGLGLGSRMREATRQAKEGKRRGSCMADGAGTQGAAPAGTQRSTAAVAGTTLLLRGRRCCMRLLPSPPSSPAHQTSWPHTPRPPHLTPSPRRLHLRASTPPASSHASPSAPRSSPAQGGTSRQLWRRA